MTGAKPIAQKGSSPLTRGAQDSQEMRSALLGLIPAYAGSTSSAQTAIAPDRAHPRLRGEHGAPAGPTGPRMGSSPLTRGAPGDPQPFDDANRLIPAYAGSTQPEPLQPHLGWAHPRLRGEHGGTDHVDPGAGGSSPLTRGARTRATAER